MKKNNLMGRYSDAKKKSESEIKSEKPKIVEYEQRYKGKSLSAKITEPQKLPTLDEKIKSRSVSNLDAEEIDENEKVSVEINGNHYLLGCSENMSAKRIKRIAALADSIISETIERNPGLTNSKVLMLSLINACDRVISEADEKDTLKVDVLFLKQQEMLNKAKNPPELTPVEKLATRKDQTKNNE